MKLKMMFLSAAFSAALSTSVMAHKPSLTKEDSRALLQKIEQAIKAKKDASTFNHARAQTFSGFALLYGLFSSNTYTHALDRAAHYFLVGSILDGVFSTPSQLDAIYAAAIGTGAGIMYQENVAGASRMLAPAGLIAGFIVGKILEKLELIGESNNTALTEQELTQLVEEYLVERLEKQADR
jgi:hypothetical protein